MKKILLCPQCKNELNHFNCPRCGYNVPVINSIYQFCDDPALKLEGDNQYIGYDNIGEDFDPSLTYWSEPDRYGVYDACADLIAKKFGTSITVLDLGAGLGTASIPLAKRGISTIGVDISNVMLNTAVKLSQGLANPILWARMNAYSLYIKENSIDVVIENAMLHLVDNPELVLKEIHRVLKPGGYLIRYSSHGQALSKEELEINRNCNQVLDDISNCFYQTLKELGYQSIWFDNHFQEKISTYFEDPINEVSPTFSEVFTDKLKFRLHRMKTAPIPTYKILLDPGLNMLG